VEDGLNPRSLKYRTIWGLELAVMRRANRVVAISQGIRDAIVEASINPGKIDIVPNGVDTGIFAPKLPDTGLIEALGLTDCFVVGFIGSLRRLEGLDLLLEGFKEFWRWEPRARLVVVGEGPERYRLETLAEEAGLRDAVRCTGFVPHGDVLRYYSVMDVLVYPRIDARINHAVTPLKPLEAMAMGKMCLASDVGGLRELVDDGVTGLLFSRGNARDLTKKLLLLASDPGMRERLATRALSNIRREREWSVIASRYPDIYHRAGVRGAEC
jgi:glycosyltransferase involved in cell wall biosynthesis